MAYPVRGRAGDRSRGGRGAGGRSGKAGRWRVVAPPGRADGRRSPRRSRAGAGAHEQRRSRWVAELLVETRVDLPRPVRGTPALGRDPDNPRARARPARVPRPPRRRRLDRRQRTASTTRTTSSSPTWQQRRRPRRRRRRTARRSSTESPRDRALHRSSSPTAWAASTPARRPAGWPSRSSPRSSPGGSARARSDDKVDPARRSATPSPRRTRRSSGSRHVRPSSRTWGRPSSSPCSATTGSTSPASATRGPTGSATARSSSSPRTTRWPTPCGEAGTISTDEVPNHKFKHVLYLYLGSKDARGGPEDVRVARRPPGRPVPAGPRRPDGRRRRRRAGRGSSPRCDDPQRDRPGA